MSTQALTLSTIRAIGIRTNIIREFGSNNRINRTIFQCRSRFFRISHGHPFNCIVDTN